MITQQMAIELATLSGILGSTLVILWKVFRFSQNFLLEQVRIKECLKEIQKEVQPNGGGSIKDIVKSLQETVSRIEVRQQIIDQRTKAGLHYKTQPLFEIDASGNILWFNEAFKKLTEDNGQLEGCDWFSIIEENFRASFIAEIDSCLRMGRKIDIDTVSQNGHFIHFVGYPYKIAYNNHQGFLIHLYRGERK